MADNDPISITMTHISSDYISYSRTDFKKKKF